MVYNIMCKEIFDPSVPKDWGGSVNGEFYVCVPEIYIKFYFVSLKVNV